MLSFRPKSMDRMANILELRVLAPFGLFYADIGSPLLPGLETPIAQRLQKVSSMLHVHVLAVYLHATWLLGHGV